MEYRELGSSGIKVSPVALGCWTFGGMNWGNVDDKESIEAIRRAIDSGTNLLDTAPIYGFGKSEEVVGKALKGRRDKVILATKCALNWSDPRGEHMFTLRGQKVYKNLFPDAIANEVEESLKRLQTDYIDLFQTHRQTDTVPEQETMAGLLKLKEQGKIRAIGVCNALPSSMDMYREAGVLDTNQPRYNLMDRAIEDDVLPYCRDNGMAVLAYSPIAQGLLTGKVTTDRKFTGDDQRKNNPWFTDHAALTRLLQTLEDVFQPIADGYGITLAQLAIAWVISQPGLTVALCGARTPDQAEQNAAAADVSLTESEMNAMAGAIAALEPPERLKK